MLEARDAILLGHPPRTTMYWYSRAFRQVQANPGALAVGGLVERPSMGLTFADLASLPAAFQVTDVAAYAKVPCTSGARLVGVRLQAILKSASAHPEAMFVNVAGRTGFRVSLFRREIEPIAIIVYGSSQGRVVGPLAEIDGGPFRFLLPGQHDEARDIPNVAVIEFASTPGRDLRTDGGLPPERPGAAGDLPWLKRAVPAAHDTRTLIIPPPTT